ncbi:hypothetical protein OH146_08715 [Salinibacterium sp. SYSU T00001]|uniref:hypothetical protein n=1 Tax=Homoserinimonas sedimenticola TaxID=2986805 RepID=UPI002235CB04|nr:hypothetical protein [Salinibacterium sedimenticola]MCW4385854.1 hypothetical protein [Salinibacterium sedimenticola]
MRPTADRHPGGAMVKKNVTVDEGDAVTAEAPEAAAEEKTPVESAAPEEKSPTEGETPAAEAPETEAEPTAPAAAEADTELPDKDPGKVLGVVGIVVSLAVGIVGFVLGLLSYRKSRAAGFGGGIGMTAMILGTITTVVLALQLVLLANGMGIGGACDGREPGVYTLDNGTTISCR